MARVFFSYSHDDELYRDQLEKHLALLRNEGLIQSWHDRRILAGSDFGEAIDEALQSADVILLLVSASFMASNYCYSIEMKRALELHERGEATVIPVIVRPCLWKPSPLSKLMAVPRDGRAITQWPNYDEAYADVAEAIRAVVEAKSSKPFPKAERPAAPPATSPVATASKRDAPLPRSSNLRLKKDFTELDTDGFLHDCFDFIARFFEGSLQELQQRHPGVEGRFRRIDANTFTASIYKSGKKMSECAIQIGGGGFRHGGITYSHDANARGNSFNEMLSVDTDDQKMFLKSMGMALHRDRESTLSAEGGAEYFWDLLIQSLQ